MKEPKKEISHTPRSWFRNQKYHRYLPKNLSSQHIDYSTTKFRNGRDETTEEGKEKGEEKGHILPRLSLPLRSPPERFAPLERSLPRQWLVTALPASKTDPDRDQIAQRRKLQRNALTIEGEEPTEGDNIDCLSLAVVLALQRSLRHSDKDSLNVPPSPEGEYPKVQEWYGAIFDLGSSVLWLRCRLDVCD